MTKYRQRGYIVEAHGTDVPGEWRVKYLDGPNAGTFEHMGAERFAAEFVAVPYEAAALSAGGETFEQTKYIRGFLHDTASKNPPQPIPTPDEALREALEIFEGQESSGESGRCLYCRYDATRKHQDGCRIDEGLVALRAALSFGRAIQDKLLGEAP